MNEAALAVLVTVNCGRFTGVVTLLLQRPAAGQVGSPPPLAVAVLLTLVATAAVGVIGMTKLLLAPAANPAAIVHVMVFLGSLLYILAYLATDIAYTFVDPRVRLA